MSERRRSVSVSGPDGEPLSRSRRIALALVTHPHTEKSLRRGFLINLVFLVVYLVILVGSIGAISALLASVAAIVAVFIGARAWANWAVLREISTQS